MQSKINCYLYVVDVWSRYNVNCIILIIHYNDNVDGYKINVR